MAFVPWIVRSVTLESDIEALRSLKRAIDPNTIPPSSFLQTWNFQVDPCEIRGENFLGITSTMPSDNSTKRVLGIDLDSGGYEGFLTPAVGNLTALTQLNLGKNKFRGPIPTTVSNLKELTRIELLDNFFTGSFPPGIDRLKRLEIVDVSHNELSGSIPRSILNCRTLTLLRLSNNEFTGKIPDLSGLWQLNTLDLSSNHLSGNLPQLPIKLKTLILRHNILSGHISQLKRFRILEAINLCDNKFSG
ncbi:leucine-rich repeat receptor-like serine/threonine-protein kinase BAM1 [Actinidia eriantha]|uniref:leucine-rich repeat receptor-like serine/threonine-protein kinase BAM1 n=1 Tax=Actinidia eriantha TaxID=165200 RepID=UPI002584A13C|nr:leucine-rich repeat receptor-like serine/threonine-protein kinase BAM1 [Actinidia eriantha]